MDKKEFRTSLYFYVPLAIILAKIAYDGKDLFYESALYGMLGALCVFIPSSWFTLKKRKV